MTYEQLFAKVKKMFGDVDVSSIQEHVAFQFNIYGEGEGAFYVEVKEGKLYIEPYEYYDRDVIFGCDADLLLELAKGNVDPILAYTTGKLKVEGNFEKAILLQNFINK